MKKFFFFLFLVFPVCTVLSVLFSCEYLGDLGGGKPVPAATPAVVPTATPVITPVPVTRLEVTVIVDIPGTVVDESRQIEVSIVEPDTFSAVSTIVLTENQSKAVFENPPELFGVLVTYDYFNSRAEPDPLMRQGCLEFWNDKTFPDFMMDPSGQPDLLSVEKETTRRLTIVLEERDLYDLTGGFPM